MPTMMSKMPSAPARAWIDSDVDQDEERDAQGQRRTSFSSPALTRYLSETRQYPLLTAEQEQDLARRYAQGDTEAGHQLVCSNLRLVVYQAIPFARFSPHNVLDLIQEGNIGLMHAARKFDPTRKVRFSSYAGYWITQAIKRALQETQYPVHLPEHLCAEIMRLKTTARCLAATAQQAPAHHLPLIQRWLAPCYSLEMPCQTEGELRPLSDVLGLLAPVQETARERQELLERLLIGLGPRERYVIALHYGLGPDGQEYTLGDIGKRLHISRERVQQLEVRALRTMRTLARRFAA